MMSSLAQGAPESSVLLNWFKPMVVLGLMMGWAWFASFYDKDLDKYHLKRFEWNLGQMGVACLSLFLLLYVPWFIVSFLLALILLTAPQIGYIYYHNHEVPDKKWDPIQAIQDFISGKNPLHKDEIETAEVVIVQPNGDYAPPPTGEDPFVPAHKTLSQIMGFSLPRDADAMEVNITPQRAAVLVHIDGVPYPQPDMEPRAALLLVDYIKKNAGLDVEDRRRQQNGKFTVDVKEWDKHVVGVETAGNTRGLNLRMTMDPDKKQSIEFDRLGMLDAQKQQLTTALDQDGKVVIIASLPKQGMTTTIYSLLERHDPYTQSITTLEDTIAFELEGVDHNVIDPGEDSEALAKRLASMIRRDPQVIMLSKVTDSQLAQVVVGSAHEIRFYMGLYMADTFQALRAWVKAIGDLQTAAESLGAIVTPRLIRRLCFTCRVPYQPDPQAMRKMNLPTQQVQQLFKHSGQVLVKGKPETCPSCRGIGYRGRIAVYEVMPFDDQARELVAMGQVDQLRAYLRQQKMLYLQEAALARVVEGITSISEVTRVFSGQDQGQAQAQQR